MTIGGVKTIVGLLWLGMIALAALAGAGWWVARWQHRYTSVSARLLYIGAAASGGGLFALMILGAALGAPGLATLGLPFVAFFGPAAIYGHRHHRRALGAGGELRAFEMRREHSAAAWRLAIGNALARKDGDARTYIANQGELVREQPIPFKTLSLDGAGGLKVAAEQGRHLFVVGQTGTGKTRTIERIIAYRVRDDRAGLVFVDPKPDRPLEGFLRALAHRTGRPFYLIDPANPDSDRYNPLADKDPGTAAEVAVGGLQMDEPFYKDAAMLHLNKIARAVHARFGTVNLSLLAAAASLQAEATVLAWAEHDAALAEELRAYYEDVNADKQRISAVAGTVLRIQTVAQRRWARVFTPNDEGQAVSLIRALRERAIVLVRPVAGEGTDEAKGVAGLLMSDLNAACTVLDEGAGDHWLAVLDEFGAVCGGPNMGHLVNLYQRARSAGGQLIAGTQSYADLPALAETAEQADSLAENFGSIIVHKQMTTASREWLSMYMGTTELWAMTDRISNHGVSPAGEGSARRAREFRVPPDTFAALGRGEVIVYTPPSKPEQGTVAMLPAAPPAEAGEAGEAYAAAGPARLPAASSPKSQAARQTPAETVQLNLSGTDTDEPAPEPSPTTALDEPGSLAPVVYADDDEDTDDGADFASGIA